MFPSPSLLFMCICPVLNIFLSCLQYYRIYLDILTIPLFLIAYVVPQVSYLHFPFILIAYVIPQVSYLHFGFLWLGMNMLCAQHMECHFEIYSLVWQTESN